MVSNPSSQSDSPVPDNAKPRKRWGRRIGWGVTGAVLVVLVAVLLLPTLLSTGVGNRVLVGVIDRSIPGSIQAEAIAVGWFGGTSAKGVILRDPQGQLVADIPSITAPSVGLWPLAMGGRNFGVVEVQANEIHVSQQAGQPTNVQQTVSKQTASQTQKQETQSAKAEPTGVDDMSVQLKFTAKKITYEAPDVEQVQMTDVDASLDMLDPQQIAVKIKSQLEQAGQGGSVNADVNLRDLFTQDGKWQPAAARVDGEADIANLPMGAVDRLANMSGKLEKLLGSNLNARVAATGPVDALTATITAQSTNLNVDARLISEAGQLRAAPDSRASLQITPAWFASVASKPGEEPAATLLQPFTLNLNINSLLIPTVKQLAAGQAAVNAGLAATDIVLDVKDRGQVALRNTNLSITAEDLAKQLQTRLTADAQYGNVTKPVQLAVQLSNLKADGQPMHAAVTATALPIALIDAVAQMQGKLTDTIGDTLDATANVTRQADGAMAFDAQFNSPNVQGPIAGQCDAQMAMSLRTPSPMQLRMTPEGFAAWTGGKDAKLRLVEPTQIMLDLKRVEIAHLKDAGEMGIASLDPDRTKVSANVTIPKAVLIEPATKRKVSIEQGELSVQGENLRDVLKILANLKLTTETPGQPPEPGTISSTTEIHDLVGSDGKVNLTTARIQSDTTIDAVPSTVIDTLANQGGQLASILGPTTSAKLNANYTPGQGGPVTFVLSADHATGNVDAQLTGDAHVQLRSPATMNLQVSRGLSEVMLKKVNPLLVQAIGSARPIALTVSEQNFSMPLRDFQLADVTANASLDMGVLQLDNGGLVQLILQAVKYDQPGRFAATFSPMDLSLADGKVRYRNMNMTIDKLVLGFSGLIDLRGDSVDLAMTLPGESLGRVLGMEGKLSSAESLTIPLRGSIDQPKLDYRALAGEVTKLALRESIGGEAGQAVGTLLDIFGTNRGQPTGEAQPPADQQQPGGETTPKTDDTQQAQEQQPPTLRDILGGFLKQEEQPKQDEAEKPSKRREK